MKRTAATTVAYGTIKIFRSDVDSPHGYIKPETPLPSRKDLRFYLGTVCIVEMDPQNGGTPVLTKAVKADPPHSILRRVPQVNEHVVYVTRDTARGPEITAWTYRNVWESRLLTSAQAAE